MTPFQLFKKTFEATASKYIFATLAVCFALSNELLARAGGGGGGPANDRAAAILCAVVSARVRHSVGVVGGGVGGGSDDRGDRQ